LPIVTDVQNFTNVQYQPDSRQGVERTRTSGYLEKWWAILWNFIATTQKAKALAQQPQFSLA
jgi:hypothetical protein